MTPPVSLPSLQGGSPCKAIARRRRARLHAVLLATSALAAVALAAAANAADATWSGATNDFNTETNWSGGALPSTDGIAMFNASTQQNISFSKNTTLGGISMTAGAGDYIFTGDAKIVTFNIVIFDGTGISVGNEASLPPKVRHRGGALFQGTTTAGQDQ